MIEIYTPGNTDFIHNGNEVLFCTSCELSAEINGTWVINLTHPIDNNGRWRRIEVEAVLKVPTWQQNKQLYRISRVVKQDNLISATAYPIFYDSANDLFLMDVRPVNKIAQEALDMMLSGSRYTAVCLMDKTATAYFVRRNFLDALCGVDEPTFLQRWGGEIEFDNLSVYVHEQMGSDTGIQLIYGKNITGIEYSIDMSEVCTRIIPIGFNGHKIDGPTPWVDSPYINVYETLYVRERTYDYIRMDTDIGEDEDTDDLVVCHMQYEMDAALAIAAENDFREPAISIDVYTDSWTGEKIGLGDTVTCKYKKFGISQPLRARSIVWDCIRNRPVSIHFGDANTDFVKEATGLEQPAKRPDFQPVFDMRNLFVGTMNPDVNNLPHLIDQNTSTSIPSASAVAVAEHGFRVTLTADNVIPRLTFGNSQTVTSGDPMNGLVAGETYTWSFDAKWKLLSGGLPESTTRLRAYLYENSTGTMSTDYIKNVHTFKANTCGIEMSDKVIFTFTVPEGTTQCYLRFSPNAGGANMRAGDFIEMKNIKLEKGSVATQWTPAYEDVEGGGGNG